MSATKVFFYVQHLLGIGHLARASRIAAALHERGFDVTVVMGGTPVPGFPGPGPRLIALPAVTAGADGFSALVDEHGQPVDDAFKARRRDLLLDAFHVAKPDIVLFEAFPFGRRQMRFELLPLIEAIEARSPRPLVAVSLRDILQENHKPGRAEETVALVKDHVDVVLVHGDPAFARIDETFPLAGDILDRIAYTGLVAGIMPEQPREHFDIVVSAGGGAVGKALLMAAVGAARTLPDNLRWCVIAGPNLPQAEFEALQGEGGTHVALFRFREDFASLLAGARLSISQAGYNTVCDVLRAGCNSILIPFTAGGETEQTLRAERLAEAGVAAIVEEDGISPERLASEVATMLARPRPALPPLDLDGAAHTAEILRERFALRVSR